MYIILYIYILFSKVVVYSSLGCKNSVNPVLITCTNGVILFYTVCYPRPPPSITGIPNSFIHYFSISYTFLQLICIFAT